MARERWEIAILSSEESSPQYDNRIDKGKLLMIYRTSLMFERSRRPYSDATRDNKPQHKMVVLASKQEVLLDNCQVEQHQCS